MTLALGAAAVVLGAQWLLHDPGWQHGNPAAVHAAPAHYRLGRIDFTPCELKAPLSGQTTAAWCAPFIRPQNPADPSGRKIHLRLALIRGSAARAAPDLVVFLAGGPGQSAVDSWPLIAPALKPVLEHRDVVLLDQRGTGGSHPLTCPKAERAAQRAREARIAAPAPRQGSVRPAVRREAETRACLAEIEKTADPRFFTTTDAVDDLIALRHALGNPRFDLIGVSYGTRVAQEYAMRDPSGVRSIVLDSVLPNSSIVGESIAVNLQHALEADFGLCKAEPACVKAFGDPATDLAELRKRIARDPPVVRYRDPTTNAEQKRTLDEARLTAVVRFFAYSPLTAALLPLSLHEAVEGHYAPMLAQSRLIAGQLGHQIEAGLELAVLCTEDVPLLKPDPAAKDTLLGARLIGELQRQCAGWPRGYMPADFHQPLHTDIPTLILEGQFDPITPPRYGKEVLAHLGDARLLIARGQGHNVIGAGCMPRLVGKFIADLEPKRLDAQCLDTLRPTPPFVSFNGSSP